MTAVFDPYSPDPVDDPYPAYRVLRDAAPVYHHPVHDFWALSHFDDVQTAARDWKTFSTAHGVELDQLPIT